MGEVEGVKKLFVTIFAITDRASLAILVVTLTTLAAQGVLEGLVRLHRRLVLHPRPLGVLLLHLEPPLHPLAAPGVLSLAGLHHLSEHPLKRYLSRKWQMTSRTFSSLDSVRRQGAN